MKDTDEQQAADSARSAALLQVLGPAGDAIIGALSNSALGALHRLITGLADWPAAILAGLKEGAEDKNYGRRAMRRGIADSAVALAQKDTALVQRTMERMVYEALPKQENREKIAKAAAEELNAIPPPPGVPPVDDEFMAKFSRYAEDVSKEDAQRLWARLLAGEIRKPGTFSGAALRILSELTGADALRFERVVRNAFGPIIPKSKVGSSGTLFDDVRLLETMGLISGASRDLEKLSRVGEQRELGGLSGRQHFVSFHGPGAPSLKVPAVFLTPLALELASLLPADDEPAVARQIVQKIPKSGIFLITIFKLDPVTRKLIKSPPPEILWASPTDPAPPRASKAR